MTTKLMQLADMAQEKDCELMLDELLAFGSEPLSESEQDDIISRVTRKVEEDMTQAKPKKKIKRRLITILAAAAILLPTGAYAASRFFHKENVDYYLKGSDRIENNPTAVKNYVMENEDYKITIDSQLSDGHNVMMIETREGKTSKGRNYLKEAMDFRVTAKYADGTETGAGYWGIEDADGYAMGEHAKEGTAMVHVYKCKGIDTKKDITMSYSAYGEEEFETLEGFEYTTSFAPNVKSVELKSADGKKLILSEFEIYSPDGKHIGEQIEFGEVSKNVSFIKSNGEKYEISEENKTSALEDHIIFGEIIDPDDYKGVEINGVEYLKQ